MTKWHPTKTGQPGSEYCKINGINLSVFPNPGYEGKWSYAFTKPNETATFSKKGGFATKDEAKAQGIHHVKEDVPEGFKDLFIHDEPMKQIIPILKRMERQINDIAEGVDMLSVSLEIEAI